MSRVDPVFIDYVPSMFDELRPPIAHHPRCLQSFGVCGNISRHLLMRRNHEEDNNYWHLQNKNLILGTASDRLYGPELDIVLKKHTKGKNVYHRSGKDTLDGLLGMLIKGRVDYLIEYPVSIAYAA